MVTLARMSLAFATQTNGPCLVVVRVGLDEFERGREPAAPDGLVVELAKNRSTMLSHEASWAEVNVEARMGLQPHVGESSSTRKRVSGRGATTVSERPDVAEIMNVGAAPAVQSE